MQIPKKTYKTIPLVHIDNLGYLHMQIPKNKNRAVPLIQRWKNEVMVQAECLGTRWLDRRVVRGLYN